MAQQHHEITEHSPRDVVVLGASNGANSGAHLADEKDFKNMRLAIGTLEKTIFQISLSDDLTNTRHIDIRLKRNNIRGQGQAKETAKGDDDRAMAMAGRDEEQPPELRHAAPPPQARLKITVAAEEEDAATANNDQNQEYLNDMRGWFLTVATLFVNMAFDSMLHPPDWMKTEWYEKGWFRTRHAAIVNPSHAAAAAVAPSPQPATASASQAFRAYFYLTSNSLTFAMALALVLMCLDRRQESSSWGTFNIMKRMVTGVSLFLALTFAMGTSNNWKVTGIACVCLVVYTYLAFSYFFVMVRKLKTEPSNQRRN
ncbi:hypothetical protein SETIT_8G182700v2 [Setaria italica]|uniref:Uncharacterized protein n=2 Tax=Setaria italica TaxID=4555 RepID=A0A368S931_SETIT|nr:uncharacterized protein LOC101766051 [Setaria italica]RCV38936.1 hypothetical protein SETIT_8G182700v2 [Setaria italica]